MCKDCGCGHNDDHKEGTKFSCPQCSMPKTIEHDHQLHLDGDEVKCTSCEFKNPAPTCDGCRVTMNLVKEAGEENNK